MHRRSQFSFLVSMLVVLIAIPVFAAQPYQGAINNTPIGTDTPAPGKFTTGEFTGNVTITGNQGITGNQTITGNETKTGNETRTGNQTINGDVTVSDSSDGGDMYGGNKIEGKLKFGIVSLGLGTNGSTNTVALMDDSPAGEFAATDADVACTTSSTHYKAGSAALKLAVTTAADAGDGCNDTGLAIDASADEAMGGWVYSSVALAAGDLQLVIVDPQLTSSINIPAIAANTWTFVDLTTAISVIADANKNGISDVGFKLSAAGATKAAAGAFNVWLDGWYKWDAADEEETGCELIRDGVYGVLAFVDDGSTGANTAATLTEYTDWFIRYTGSNEKIVWITDQSATNNVAFIATTAGP